MKHQWIIVLAWVLLGSCDENEEQETVSFQHFISGNAIYTDILANEEVRDQQAVEVSIKNTNQVPLPESFTSTTKGPSFEFGPLDPDQSYTLIASYRDDANKVTYADTLIITINEISLSGPGNAEESPRFLSETVVFTILDLKPAGNSLILGGRVSYRDIFTNLEVNNQNAVKTTLVKTSGQPFGNEFARTAQGFAFSFNNLNEDTQYDLTSEFSDETTGARYLYQDTIDMVAGQPFVFLEVMLQADPEFGFLFGTVNYVDQISNKLIKVSEVIGSISHVSPFSQLPPGTAEQTIKSPYRFGPLPVNNEYAVQFSLKDSHELQYLLFDTLTMSFGEPTMEKNYQLQWKPETTAVVVVTDSLNNPVEGVEIFTYNNYNFLLEFKNNSGASIAESISDSQGQAVFKSLNPIKHFFYGLVVINGDSLTTLDPAFDPDGQGALIENQINRDTIRLVSIQ